ncbi:MAG: helix-turn-helix transcriptional regulator, partial [Ruminococcus sp.]|nr:helix-turn-helix transcriptional regulator [Ruminococcus sp.]
VKAMLDARKKTGMTQKELSEKTGIAQADISRLETGNANPSLKTLQRLAEGMGMTLKLEFIPVV